jgi:hypothetical protein
MSVRQIQVSDPDMTTLDPDPTKWCTDPTGSGSTQCWQGSQVKVLHESSRFEAARQEKNRM